MKCKKCLKDKNPDDFGEVQHKAFSPISGEAKIYSYKRTTCIECMRLYAVVYAFNRKNNEQKTAS